jgi:tetratricopeptide (TPR) repeat protein
MAAFVESLEALRQAAGAPSFRALAKQVGQIMRPAQTVAASTISDVFRPWRRRLDVDLVTAIVRVLGRDEAEVAAWRNACLRMQAEAKSGGPSGVLRQLPANLTAFTGRQEEIARILATGAAQTPAAVARVISIEGMAGIGKTQLAVHVAHLLVATGKYADIQLFVNLHGYDPDFPPADPALVLETLLRQLGVPSARIPEGTDDRAAMFRAEIHGRNALLLLDNAAGANQVRNLIPASNSCLVIVTSRRSLAMLGNCASFRLDLFTADEEAAMLTAAIGAERVAAEPEAVRELLTICGGLPLGLAMAAAKLRSRPTWRVADLVTRLHERGVDAVSSVGQALSSVFDLSYQLLPAAAQRILTLVAVHPGDDFDARSVAALADIGITAADALLELLLDEHLVLQRAPDRYYMHDLVHAYVRGIDDAATRAARGEAAGRLAAWLAHTAYAAATTIAASRVAKPSMPTPCPPLEFGSFQQAIGWFDSERAMLSSAVHLAASHGHHAAAWQLGVNIGGYCLVRDWYGDCIPTQLTALESARVSGDVAGQISVLICLGSAYHHSTQNSTDAARCFREVIELSGSVGDRRDEVRGLIDLAIVSDDIVLTKQVSSDGLAPRLAALAAAEELGASDLAGIASLNVGVYHYFNHDPAQALEAYMRALRYFADADPESRSVAQVLGNIGDAYVALGEPDRGLDFLNQQLELATRRGYDLKQAEARMDIGVLLDERGEHDAAREHWRLALELYERLGDVRGHRGDEARRRLGTA